MAVPHNFDGGARSALPDVAFQHSGDKAKAQERVSEFICVSDKADLTPRWADRHIFYSHLLQGNQLMNVLINMNHTVDKAGNWQ
jgi:hypothetical protein